MPTVFGSQIAVAFLVSAVGAALVVGSAAVAYDVRLPVSVAGVLLAWLVCGLLFSALGLLLSCIPSSRGALGAGLGLFFVMMLLSGVGPPPEVLTGPMRALSNALPLTYAVRLLQSPWLGLDWSWTDLAVVLGFTAAALVGWRALVRWD
jgi:ABC-2 type transport system permease protein